MNRYMLGRASCVPLSASRRKFLIGSGASLLLAGCGGESAMEPLPTAGGSTNTLKVVQLSASDGAALNQAGFTAYARGSTMYQSQSLANADESIRRVVENHIVSGVPRPTGASTTRSPLMQLATGGGGGQSGYWQDTITTTTGTGYDPYTGGTYDSWSFWTNSYTFVSTGVSYDNSDYSTSTYYWGNVQKKPATCIGSVAGLAGIAASLYAYMASNASAFSMVIKVGLTAGPAWQIAQNYMGLGVAGVTVSASLAFLTGILVDLPAVQIAVVCGAVAGLVGALATVAVCLGIAE